MPSDQIAPIPCAAQLIAGSDWPAITRCFADHNLQQTLPYAERLAEQHGARNETVAVHDEAGDVLGAACVRVRSVPLIGGIAYITGGPLTRVNEPGDGQRLTATLDALVERYVHQRGLTLRILAPVGPPEWMEITKRIYASRGMEEAPSRGYRTFLLDLERSENDLRSACSKYWRRNLRRSERADFTTCFGDNALSGIVDMHRRLRTRKGFEINLDADFYRAIHDDLVGDERLSVTGVELNGRLVCGLIVSTLGDTCVPLILATEEEGLRSYAAYALQWHSIRTARDCGMRFYDLGGHDQSINPGVYNFKKGLRGDDVTAPGPFEQHPSPLRRAILQRAERIHHMRLALRRGDARAA